LPAPDLLDGRIGAPDIRSGARCRTPTAPISDREALVKTQEYAKPTAALTARQRAQEAAPPGGPRIVHDRRGIHHSTRPHGSFAEGVAQHAEERQRAVLETLLVTRRLRAAGVLGPRDAQRVGVEGAVRQAFHGTDARPACHVLPGQITFDSRLPWQLRRPGSGQVLLAEPYLQRVKLLFARCTLQPALVNGIDVVLDWHEAAGFAEAFEGAVAHVVAGDPVEQAYEAWRQRRRLTLGRLAEAARDLRFDVPLVMHLFGARPRTPVDERAAIRTAAERLCGARDELAALREQYLEVLDVYHEVEWRSPTQTTAGRALAADIDREDWGLPAS
jgi:hypothetical protein